jgi:hypothetical protein
MKFRAEHFPSIAGECNKDSAASDAQEVFTLWLNSLPCIYQKGNGGWYQLEADPDRVGRILVINELKENLKAIECRGCGNIYKTKYGLPKSCLNCGVDL